MFVLKSMIAAIIMVFTVFFLAVFDIKVFPGELISERGIASHQFISLKSVIVFENGSINPFTFLFSSIVILTISIVFSSLTLKLIFKKYLAVLK